MGQYRLTINREGHKAGSTIELEADDALVLGGFAVPVSGGSKPVPAPAPAPAPEPVVEELVVEEAPAEAAEEGDKSSSRRRRSSSDE